MRKIGAAIVLSLVAPMVPMCAQSKPPVIPPRLVSLPSPDCGAGKPCHRSHGHVRLIVDVLETGKAGDIRAELGNPVLIDAATTAQITTLYSLGARIFEIALLPQDIPAFTDSAVNLNPGYEALVPELQAEFPDATIELSNWGPDYDNILTNPSEFGFTNTTNPCAGPPVCATPDTFFYYFNSHPSDAAHHIVGNDLFTEVLGLPAPVPEPSTGR